MRDTTYEKERSVNIRDRFPSWADENIAEWEKLEGIMDQTMQFCRGQLQGFDFGCGTHILTTTDRGDAHKDLSWGAERY